MSDPNDPRQPSRRKFLTGAASAAAVTAVGAAVPRTANATAAAAAAAPVAEAFFGRHQAGIATRQQSHTYFAAFDLLTAKTEDVVALLKQWTEAAARLTQGRTAAALTGSDTEAPTDSGEALDLPAHRLTLTFGFGAGLFQKDGVDRYGLAARRPRALIDLPRFNGDQLVPERTGGDLCVQACADDPQVAFHAVRQLARLAYPAAQLRWAQTGFLSGARGTATPRNLMGFKDGTMNVAVDDPAAMDRFVWVGDEGGWMQRGTYMVVRPIRISLEHWDRMKLRFQEQVVGRHKQSGAPLGRQHERDDPDFEAVDADGNPVIPENAHVRLTAPASNDGAQILRRGYSYDNGLSFTAERWPPWHQGMEFDAGLLFVCHQRDPRSGFVRIFENASRFDMLNQFVTHTGSGLFACPPGIAAGEFIGQPLFAAS